LLVNRRNDHHFGLTLVRILPFDNRTAYVRPKEVPTMAKTEEGKKVVPVKPYRRKVNGKTVSVKRHKRSTPN